MDEIAAMDCYIYYKSDVKNATQVIASVEILRSVLPVNLAQTMRLQKRPAISNDQITWMEIYRDVPEDFQYIVDVAVKASALSQWVIGERRLEYFIDVVSHKILPA